MQFTPTVGTLSLACGTFALIAQAQAQFGLPITAPVPLNTTATNVTPPEGGHDFDPQIAADGLGNWVAVWSSNDQLGNTIGTGYEMDILVARSTDFGATWTPPAPLNTNAGSDSRNDYDPQVATDSLGNWVAVWSSLDTLGDTIGKDRDILVARSTDNGAVWTAPAPLNSTASFDSSPEVSTFDHEPQLATDGLGNWVVVWWARFASGVDTDVFVSRSSDNGATWSAMAPLYAYGVSDSSTDDEARIATDGLGNWMVVWHSTRNVGGFIGDDSDILLVRSTNNGATWTAPAPLNTNAGANDGIGHASPKVATDGLGNWVAVWRFSGPNDPMTLAVAHSTDNGFTWTAPASLNPSASSTAYPSDPQVTTDGYGNWVTVWESSDTLGGTIGPESDILVARSTDNGATWTAGVPLNTNATIDTGRDWKSQLASDGLGHWVVVWASQDDLGGTIDTDGDILAARFQLDIEIPAPGNCNGDSAVDLIDYLDFFDCQSSPGQAMGANCACFDFDDDNDADVFDFAVFQLNFTPF